VLAGQQHPDPVGPRRQRRPYPDPGLLAIAAVHHHLVRQGLRMQTGLVVETGEAREVHHFCVLAGYGAEAVNPYLAFETLEQIRVKQGLSLKAYEVQKNYIKAIGKGILKVMSKMGISTYQSYCGAQIFDAVGLSSEFIEKYFTGTATTVEGIGIKGDRRGMRAPPPRRVRRQSDLSQHAGCGRRLCLPPARRRPCLDAGKRVAAAACGARQESGRLRRCSRKRSTTRMSAC
jgi:hypothetical protein